MQITPRPSGPIPLVRSLLFSVVCLVLCTSPAHADPGEGKNPVIDWSQIVQPAIHNATAPRSGGSAQVLHTLVALAMYDAVVAIQGGYQPFAAAIQVNRPAHVGAAVATAAYMTARARVFASQVAYLDEQYLAYLTGIRNGKAKTEGVRVGQEAASALLALRDDDGFFNVVPYECSSVPPPVGEFEPDTGCPAAPSDPQPADVKQGQIKPFSFDDPTEFRPRGPRAQDSTRYLEDYLETRDYGRADSALRSAEQTDVAYFWAEHPYAHWNRNLIRLALDYRLNTRRAARFFAMVHTAASDATIAGFEAKYHYVAWRPRTAIPRADTDANPDTEADPSWTPLLKVNHPEYPSGHGFWSAAVISAVADFFGTRRVVWTIHTSPTAVPQLVKTERRYHHLDALMAEIENARVWAGLHWRHSIVDGERIGRRVAKQVSQNYFQPTLP